MLRRVTLLQLSSRARNRAALTSAALALQTGALTFSAPCSAGSRVYEQAPVEQAAPSENSDPVEGEPPQGAGAPRENTRADTAAPPAVTPAESPQEAPTETVEPAVPAADRKETRRTRSRVIPQLEPRRGGSNYFVVNALDGSPGCERDDSCEQGIIKFQIDLEYDIVQLEQWPSAGFFYLTFPLKILSFWDLLDQLPESRSAPFIETNYSPGLEATWILPLSLHGSEERAPNGEVDGHGIFVGVMHQSNGLGFVTQTGADQELISRSWNRLYGGVRSLLLRSPRIQLNADLTLWAPFASEAIPEWPNGETGADRLQDHLGYGELLANLRINFGSWTDFRLRAAARMHSLDAELRWSIKNAQLWDGAALAGNGFRFDLLAHCYVGKGERLIPANQVRRACYVGFGL